MIFRLVIQQNSNGQFPPRFNREALAIELGQGLRGENVVEVLNGLVRQRGAPKFLFADNGAEFTGRLVDLWAYHHGVRINFSRPGKPTDNPVPSLSRGPISRPSMGRSGMSA